jgi:hypothetical protein
MSTKIILILDEAAVLRVVGGPDVMREQLAHLAAMAAQPHVTIQVLRLDAGAHPGTTGEITVLAFPDLVAPDVVYQRGGAEVGTHDLRRAQWRISSHSANGSTCVQVARNLPGIVAVRDSKDPSGAALVFTPEDWRAFIAQLRAGQSVA